MARCSLSAEHPLLAQIAAGKVFALGHRGARAYAPMNTIPSFLLAMEQGADGVELDVWRTRDGHLVVIHDDTVDSTTDGSGHIHDMTLAEVKALDAGAWFDPRYAGVRIPTLDEVFDALPTSAVINVEIKKLEDEAPDTDGIEALTAACILRHQAQDRVIVSSFNRHALRHFRQQPGTDAIPLGYLYMAGDAVSLLGDFAAQVSFLHPYHEPLTAEIVQAIRAGGRQINTWTVNERERMTALLEMGVIGLISDVPDVMRTAVDEWQRARPAHG